MARIRKNEKREMPALSTASLPDIIFMLLFFFMAVTSLKEVNYRVKIVAPQATELQKLENKSTIRYIYVGKPLPAFAKTYGTETQIQLNDAFANVSQLQDYVVRERSAMKAEDQALMIVSIRADKDTHMGVIADIKQALRKANALKISYAAQKKEDN